MRAWLAVVLIAPVLTVGCTDTGPLSSRFVTAQEAHEAARASAEAWDPRAKLVLVVGVEPSQATYDDADLGNASDDEPFSLLVQRPDPDVGDGRAQAWLYGFRAPEQGAWLVVIEADSDIVFEEARGQDSGQAPITGWQIDSDQAAITAQGNNGTWANVTDTDDAYHILGQGNTSEDPTWALGLDAPEGRGDAVVGVNATTGRYLGSTGLELGPLGAIVPPPPEKGSFTSNVTIAEPQATHRFTIDEPGHPWLYLKVRTDLPGGSLAVNLTDPDGHEVGSIGGEGMAGEQRGFFEQEDPQQGTWEIHVELPGGAAQRYWLGWCATGFPPSPDPGPQVPDRPDPCQEPDLGPSGP